MAQRDGGCGDRRSAVRILSSRELRPLDTLVFLYFSCYLQAHGPMLAAFGDAARLGDRRIWRRKDALHRSLGSGKGADRVTQYVVRRLIQLVFVLFGVSLVVFLTMHVLPGDVAQMLLGDRATNEQLARLRNQLGLDQPIHVQYLRFAIGALQGDFGISLRSNRPAFDDDLYASPVT